MTQKNIKIYINENYSKSPEKNYNTNKTDVYLFDDIWSLDFLDSKDYGLENNRNYRYVLVVIDNFSNFVWTVPLKNKKARIINDSSEKSIKGSKIKPGLIESD